MMDEFESIIGLFDKTCHEVHNSISNEMILNMILLKDSVMFDIHEKKEIWVEDTGDIQFTFRLGYSYSFELMKIDIVQLVKNEMLADFLMQRASNFLATLKKKESE